jgi:hypothetical protein
LTRAPAAAGYLLRPTSDKSGNRRGIPQRQMADIGIPISGRDLPRWAKVSHCGTPSRFDPHPPGDAALVPAAAFANLIILARFVGSQPRTCSNCYGKRFWTLCNKMVGI